MADDRHKRKGKRLAEAAAALNALGGTWQLAPVEPPTTGWPTRLAGRSPTFPATMRWQDQLREGDEVVGAIGNPG